MSKNVFIFKIYFRDNMLYYKEYFRLNNAIDTLTDNTGNRKFKKSFID